MLLARRCSALPLLLALFVAACFQTQEAPEAEESASTEERSATAEVTYRAAAPEVAERNLLRVALTPDCRVRVEGTQASIAEVRTAVKRHVLNAGHDPRRAESASAAVVAIAPAPSEAGCAQARSDAVGEVQAAYREIWDQEVRKRGFVGYEDYVEQLASGAPNEVRRAIPDQIYVLSASAVGEEKK